LFQRPVFKCPSARAGLEATILLVGGWLYGHAVVLILLGQHDARFLSEDGPIENGTAAVLVAGAVLALARGSRSGGRRDWRGLATGLFLAVVLVFGAGEELSWGQRMLGYASPAFFQEMNSHGEVTLHNLVFGWFRLNFHVFGPPMVLATLLWAFCANRAVKARPAFRRIVRSWDLPVPRLRHAWLLVLVLVAEVALGLVELADIGVTSTQEHSEFAACVIGLCVLVNRQEATPEES
jgi:hypothetical protein